MILTRTPYRISFFGGGSDYPAFYEEHGGAVLNATINKYCHIVCRYLPPYFTHKHYIRYSKTELPNSVDEIVHPSVRECLRFMGVTQGVEITHSGDIPAMSGVGSSSAFTVGLLHALNALQGKLIPRHELALNAIHVEQKMIGENVGSQDQVAAAFGGLNLVEFSRQKTFSLTPLPLAQETVTQLQDNLMLFYTGISRFSSEIAAEQISNVSLNIKRLEDMRQMAYDAVNILVKGKSLHDFGELSTRPGRKSAAWATRFPRRRLTTSTPRPKAPGRWAARSAAPAVADS
jgi:Predicted kinase related to galactokinase and mevalonate kinase